MWMAIDFFISTYSKQIEDFLEFYLTLLLIILLLFRVVVEQKYERVTGCSRRKCPFPYKNVPLPMIACKRPVRQLQCFWLIRELGIYEIKILRKKERTPRLRKKVRFKTNENGQAKRESKHALDQESKIQEKTLTIKKKEAFSFIF